MPNPRRLLPLLAVATVVFFSFLYYSTNVKETWRGLPQKIGLGESIPEPAPSVAYEADGPQHGHGLADPTPTKWSSIPHFEPGVGRPADYNFSTVLVIPRMKNEEVDWVHEHLPDYQTAIYVADDPSAPLHPPKNKGHEVMTYLSWIIDNYADLPDVAIFLHAHRWAWHNNDLLDLDTVQMVKRLNPNRVLREGYMNMRCHWEPGCPDWMHPGEVEDDNTKHEQKLLAKAWSELFPLDPIPEVLAQPCCAQFALSSERIRAIPLQRFVAYRDWLLRTPLDDSLSGRIWEYIWQFVFTGSNVHCPVQHICYCDGFGVCFGNEDNYNSWMDLRWQQLGFEADLKDWHDKVKMVHDATEEGAFDELADIEIPEVGRDLWIEEQIENIRNQLRTRRDEALERGKDPRIRAEESGREWHEGDAF